MSKINGRFDSVWQITGRKPQRFDSAISRVETPNGILSATLNDALHFVRTLSATTHSRGYLLAPFGWIVLRGRGRDVDILAVPWRAKRFDSSVEAIRLFAQKHPDFACEFSCASGVTGRRSNRSENDGHSPVGPVERQRRTAAWSCRLTSNRRAMPLATPISPPALAPGQLHGRNCSIATSREAPLTPRLPEGQQNHAGQTAKVRFKSFINTLEVVGAPGLEPGTR